MPKVLISDSLSNLANKIFEKNNIEVDTIVDLSPEKLKEVSDSDNILRNKVEFIKYRLLRIYKDFNFPGNLKTSINLTIR